MNDPKQQTPNLTERSRRKLLSLVDRIPPLPEVVTRLLGIMNREDCDPADIEDVLQYEPVLAGQVLMLVNSPLFGVNREITTIRDGVVLLGFSPLRSMLIAHSASKTLLADYTCYGHDKRGLWDHAVATAACARHLAIVADMDFEAREVLFLGGLLHDAGKMLLAPTFQSKRIATCHYPDSVTNMERQILGIDHCEAGSLIAAKWGLTETVQEMIQSHHGDTGAPADYRAYCAAIRVADAYAHELGHGFLAGQAGEAIYLSEDLELLGLRGARWDEARADMTERVADAAAAMQSITGSA